MPAGRMPRRARTAVIVRSAQRACAFRPHPLPRGMAALPDRGRKSRRTAGALRMTTPAPRRTGTRVLAPSRMGAPCRRRMPGRRLTKTPGRSLTTTPGRRPHRTRVRRTQGMDHQTQAQRTPALQTQAPRSARAARGGASGTTSRSAQVERGRSTRRAARRRRVSRVAAPRRTTARWIAETAPQRATTSHAPEAPAFAGAGCVFRPTAARAIPGAGAIRGSYRPGQSNAPTRARLPTTIGSHRVNAG